MVTLITDIIRSTLQCNLIAVLFIKCCIIEDHNSSILFNLENIEVVEGTGGAALATASDFVDEWES